MISNHQGLDQRIVRVTKRHAYVECAHCLEVQCVDRDEDGGGAIEQHPCQECGAHICENCEQFTCARCDVGPFCKAHGDKENLCPTCQQLEKECVMASMDDIRAAMWKGIE